MAFNGSGVFQRIYNWVADRDAAININASRMDTEMDGMATGLSNCVTKDGQTTVTANLPMAGFHHTGVGNGSARNNYAAIGQVQDGAFSFVSTVGGSGDAITLTPSPALTAYAAGQRFQFIAQADNTTNVTVAVSGLTTMDLYRQDQTGLQAGELQSQCLIDIIYDGQGFVLQIPPSANDRYAIIGHQVFN